MATIKDTPKVIDCDLHGVSPWHIICDHLMDGVATDWYSIDVDDGREVECDWVCEDCLAKHEADDDSIDHLHAVCMHCVRLLREEHCSQS